MTIDRVSSSFPLTCQVNFSSSTKTDWHLLPVSSFHCEEQECSTVIFVPLKLCSAYQFSMRWLHLDLIGTLCMVIQVRHSSWPWSLYNPKPSFFAQSCPLFHCQQSNIESQKVKVHVVKESESLCCQFERVKVSIAKGEQCRSQAQFRLELSLQPSLALPSHRFRWRKNSSHPLKSISGTSPFYIVLVVVVVLLIVAAAIVYLWRFSERVQRCSTKPPAFKIIDSFCEG